MPSDLGRKPGYRLRPVSEVIRSAYGTEAEKAALLVALQQAVGIRAEIKAAFPKTEDKERPDLPLSAWIVCDQ